jgi:hypothetical protein
MGLKRAGHQVTVATNENFALFVRQCDLEFVEISYAGRSASSLPISKIFCNLNKVSS